MQTENETHNLAPAPQESLRPAIRLPAAKEPAPANPFDGGKKIKDTFGGRWVKRVVDWGVGFGFNSTLSGVIVYYINPHPQVQQVKQSLGSAESSIRRAFEILSAYVAGVITTVILSVVGPHRENIAYRLNQWFGKDTDVKTREMSLNEWKPKNEIEQIEYQISKRVNDKMTWKDIWKARLLGMAVVLPGNELLGRFTRFTEKKTGHSLDTGAWKMGGWFYDLMAKSPSGKGLLDKANAWFSRHDASVAHIRENVGDSYYRLEQVETHGKIYEPDLKKAKTLSQATASPVINETRVATREFFRTIFGVEIPWTIVMAGIVAKWSEKFQSKRIMQETQHAIADLKASGAIKNKYNVAMDDKGKVKITAANPPATANIGEGKQWADQLAAPAATKLEAVEQRPATAPAGVGV